MLLRNWKIRFINGSHPTGLSAYEKIVYSQSSRTHESASFINRLQEKEGGETWCAVVLLSEYPACLPLNLNSNVQFPLYSLIGQHTELLTTQSLKLTLWPGLSSTSLVLCLIKQCLLRWSVWEARSPLSFSALQWPGFQCKESSVVLGKYLLLDPLTVHKDN